MENETLTVVDNRTGKSYTLPFFKGCIRTMDLRQIKVSDDDFGVMGYDPAFMNTASCQSAITFIDGDRGILRYRGYPIEQLAEKCSYLEVCYLILYGELPNQDQLKQWEQDVTHHSMVPEDVKKLLDGFQKDAHPMGTLMSLVAALSTYYPDAKNIADPACRKLQILRLLGKTPTLAAYIYRHSHGLPYVAPDHSYSYTENFMNMLWKPVADPEWKPNKVLARALDVLFILHADHEQNCSTNTMRSVGSSHADPFSSAAAAIGALSGPLHGGANEEVLKMLDEIGSVENIPAFIEQVKAGKGRLMGFGHRVYKNYDPRARIIKQTADAVFAVTGRNPKLDIAIELEKIALSDEYFIKRRLYPNVDFYSGIIYQAMGFKPEIFTVLFAIGRMVGWLAQWEEMLNDKEQKIARPRQIYIGYDKRDVPK
ncbi:MAG: citrate synthase [Bryobacteraceae bacterium]